MKTKILSLVMLVFTVISCQNDQLKDLTIKLDSSSKLTVKLVDSKGVAIANNNIKIYDREYLSSTSSSSSSSSTSSFGYLFSQSTDANGTIDFGEVASGTYFLVIDSVRVNGVRYNPVMQFQINSSVDKQITINPEEFFMNVNLNLQKSTSSKASNLISYSAFGGVNVIFVPSYTYSSSYNLDKLISLSLASGKTNDNGSVAIKLPAYNTFTAIVYNDAKTIFSCLRTNSSSYSSSYVYSFSGDKGQNLTYNLSLDSKTMAPTAYGTYNLTFNQPVYIPSSTFPSTTPFSGLNVAAIPSDVYDSSFPLSMLLDLAEYSGKTDLSGKISFSLPLGVNYQMIVYNDSKSIFTSLSASPYSSFYVYADETKQASFIISPTTLAPATYGKIAATISKTAASSYSSALTDLAGFSSLKVAVVPYASGNSSLSVDNLLLSAICSGTTDASGKILFSVPANSSYNSTYYQIVAYDASKTTKFVSTSISLYTGNTSTQSYILNATNLALIY